MQIYVVETSETLQPGLRLMTEDNTREVGELIDFCSIGNNQFIIAASLLLEHPLIIRIEGHTSSLCLKK